MRYKKDKLENTVAINIFLVFVQALRGFSAKFNYTPTEFFHHTVSAE